MFRNCDQRAKKTWFWRSFYCVLTILPLLLLPWITRNALHYTTASMYGNTDCVVRSTTLAGTSCDGQPCDQSGGQGPKPLFDGTTTKNSNQACDCFTPQWNVIFVTGMIQREGTIFGGKTKNQYEGQMDMTRKVPGQYYKCYYLRTDFSQLAWSESIEPHWPNIFSYWNWKRLSLAMLFIMTATLLCVMYPFLKSEFDEKLMGQSNHDMQLIPEYGRFHLGDWVEVYSSTEQRWHYAEVIEVTPTHFVVAYKNRRKMLRNDSPNVRKLNEESDSRPRARSYSNVDRSYTNVTRSSDYAHYTPYADPTSGATTPYNNAHQNPTRIPHENPQTHYPIAYNY